MLTLELFFGVGQGKVIEKTISVEDRRVLGIVPFGGAEVSIGSTGKDFDLVFSFSI